MAGAFPPLSFQKGWQRGRGCLFIKGVWTGTFWGCDFFPERFLPACSQTCPKSYLCNFTCNFSPTKIINTFLWCDLQKRSSCVFLQTLEPFFKVKQRWVLFLPVFSGILPRFLANQNFWGCACTSISNTTAFHNSIIGNFVVYQERLLQLFRHPENSEWFSQVFWGKF